MKKILYSIIVLFIAIGCTHLDDYDSIDMGTGTDITISVSNVDFESFTVTISPASGTEYYAYLVVEGAQQNLTPSLVFQNNYTGLADGSLKYSENSSYTFTVQATPGTTYQIYAISGNPNGVLGDLENISVTTLANPIEDVLGTYTMTVYAYFEEVYLTESSIILEKVDETTLSIHNLFQDSTVIYGTWDKINSIYIEDEQYLADYIIDDTVVYEIYFINADAAAPVEWTYNEDGNIYAYNNWAYYMINSEDDEDADWWEIFTETTLEPSTSTTPGSVKSTNVKAQNVDKKLELRTEFKKIK